MAWWKRSATRPHEDARLAGGPDETKASRAGPLIAMTHVGRPRWTPRDYASLAAEGYGRNPVAYRCVRMIAEAAASTRLAVFVEGQRDEAHPLARLLARPNAEQGGSEWLEGVYGALQTAGNAYIEAVGEGGTPEELWSLRPDRVKIVPGAAGWPEAYEYGLDGRKVRLTRGEDGWMPVTQLKLFHPTDDYYGMSPLEAAAFAIDVHNASGAWNKALLDNAARPSGALVYGAKDGERMTSEQFEMLRAELSEQHSGAANAGRPLLLEGGLDWKPMSLFPPTWTSSPASMRRRARSPWPLGCRRSCWGSPATPPTPTIARPTPPSGAKPSCPWSTRRRAP